MNAKAAALPSQKKCGRCQTVKPAAAFCISRQRGDGLHTRCRECAAAHYQSRRDVAMARMREYHARNREDLLLKQRANREARLSSQRVYQATNKDAIRAQQREYGAQNKEAISRRNREQYLKNKTARNDYAKRWNAEQREANPLFRLKSNLRTRTNGAIRRGGFTKLSGLNEALGCDWPKLKSHMESHFAGEMTWENYGSFWVVDHHVPLAIASSAEELTQLCHYTNLRPLGKLENLKKGASMPTVSGESR